MVGRLFGRFFVVFGQFFHKNIWSPCTLNQFYKISEHKSNIILIKSSHSLDWLHILNLTFNYPLINSIIYYC
jgi:hypothetical protein